MGEVSGQSRFYSGRPQKRTINGELQPWPDSLSRELRNRLDIDHEADLRGATDGEVLGALWRTHFRRTRGRDAAQALRTALREARDLVRQHDGGEMKTNVILSSATTVLAVRYSEKAEPNSLYYLEGEPRWQGGALVVSEPLDDGPGWHEVGPATLVRVGAGGVHLEPLDLEHARLAPRRRRSA